ncbi:MAG: hypothetical protein V4613_09240 [Bacteroidota bacterium]
MMKNRMLKNSSVLLLMLAASISLYGGDKFIAQAKVQPVTSTGFHRIQLSSEYTGLANQSLGNIRLFDQKNKEVPFIIRKETDFEWNKLFIPFAKEAYSITVDKGKQTTVLIHNSTNEIFNQLMLQIKETELNKHYVLSGSDDNAHWYGITESKLFGDVFNSGSKKYFKTVDFRAVAYKYYRIVISDTISEPYNIVQVGSLQMRKIPGAVNQQVRTIAGQSTMQYPEKKQTVLTTNFLSNVAIHRICLKVASPAMFRRQAIIRVKTNVEEAKGKKQEQEIIEYSIVINSDDSLDFEFPEVFAGSIELVINNEDNAPLEIKQIEFFQYATYLVASLEPNKQYALMYGLGDMRMPEYDLRYFTDKIDKVLPLAYLGPVEIQKHPQELSENHFWQSGWFMWVCIGVVGLVVVFITISLLKDMKRTGTD